MSFVSGAYNWYYQGVYLGIVEDAPRVRFADSAEPILGDNTGDMPQGFINRGVNATIEFVFQEWDNAAVQAAFWPWNSSPGQVNSTNSSDIRIGCVRGGGLLVGQALTGSCGTPGRFYALRAMLTPGSDVSFLMGSRLRNVPLSLTLLPWFDSVGSQAPTSSPTTMITHVEGDGNLKLWETGSIPG